MLPWLTCAFSFCLWMVGSILVVPYVTAKIQDDVIIQQLDDVETNITELIQSDNTTHRIYIEGDEFKLDGESLYIKSGSLHYFRVPWQYWRDRLRKVKAAGLNAVSTYVEWSFHEPEERQYRFSGDQDVAAFIRIAAEEGLHVLLRPGPYICAERDLGGLPYWLLSKYPNIQLRTKDKDFIAETTIWFNKLFEQITPLLFGNGGPIILVQVENEYGSFGADKVYMGQLKDLILNHVGSNALLYTTDGSTKPMVVDGRIDGTLTTIDFGATSDEAIKKAIKILRDVMPSGPVMNSEFYTGWLTLWGGARASVPTQAVVSSLRYLLRNHVNFNLYMVFGGTNFGFSSGALDGPFLPHVTSYDYDAPISEAGDVTHKYDAIRKLLIEFDPRVSYIPEPTVSKKGAYGLVTLHPSTQLLSPHGIASLGKQHSAVSGPKLPTFEALRQRAGLMLYETYINVTEALLSIAKPRDDVLVYLDNKKQGTIRRFKDTSTNTTIVGAGGVSKLSLLVENQGRVNYGGGIRDFKGILSDVVLGTKALTGPWNVTGFPLQDLDVVPPANGTEANSDVIDNTSDSPVLYEGSFVLPHGGAPMDTFINTAGWTKGVIWINGHNLGRYWRLGPQQTLFVPGVWLQAAPTANRLQVLEISTQPSQPAMNLTDHPSLGINY